MAIPGQVMPSEGLGNVSWITLVKKKKPKEEGTFAIYLCNW